MPHSLPALPAAPPRYDEDLPDYIAAFLIANGTAPADALEHVANFEGWSLRPAANYVYQAGLTLAALRAYRLRVQRMRLAALITPVLFLLGTTWSLLRDLIPEVVYLAGQVLLLIAIAVSARLIWSKR